MTATEELTAILSRVVIEPDCDTNRLVYADRLDERGEPGDVEWAEFVRLDVTRDDGGLEWNARRMELWDKFVCPWCQKQDWHNDAGLGTCMWGGGFVKNVGCTAEWFLKYADALIWHPEQTVDKRFRTYAADQYGPNEYETVKVPRPCPPTAQPIRKVRFTTSPADTGSLNDFALYNHREEDGVYRWRSFRWPGIEFELPG